ncbi:MAG: hypothetical protein CMB99_11985 [Flavobacteriaceae bacterium]|nr:hypothetical protein [Flavobacteriaceae bacterium]
MTLLFLIVTICTLITIYIIRRKYNREQRKLQENAPKIRELFEDVLFTDKNYSAEEIFNRFEEIVGEVNEETLDFGLDVLVEIKNDGEEESDKYDQIIDALGLIEHLEEKFGSRSNSKIIDAFQQAFVLELSKFDAQILQYAYSRNKKLRNEARNSYLALSANDPYRFFNEIEGTLTKWDEIELMQYLELQNERGNLEGLGKWINYSKNNSLVIFLVKMVGHFKQRGIDDILIEKLEDEDAQVRAVSIDTIGQLNLNQVEQTLIERYYTEPEICQVAIIRTIEKFNTGKALDFLKQAFEESNNTDTKKIIAEAILNYSYEGRMAFQNLKNTLNGFDLTILQHVETPLIKYK